MIRVNLLPPEYRVKERTPLPMMMGILGGVVVTALVVVAFLYLRLHQYPTIVRQLRNKQETRNFYMQKAKKFDQLVAEKKSLEGLDNAVKKLREDRYPWTKAIDDLGWKVMVANRHKKVVKGWYEKLDFGFATQRMARPGGPDPGGEIKFDLVVAGREYDHVAVFRDVLRDDKQWLGKNILSMPLTEIKPQSFKEYIPDVGLKTSLTISLNPEIISEQAPPDKGKAGEGEAKKTAGKTAGKTAKNTPGGSKQGDD
ncbi:MAG: hypothetical protein ACYTFG_19785 [Planctomycetota bacterium]|jgi:hypothetical protein